MPNPFARCALRTRATALACAVALAVAACGDATPPSAPVRASSARPSLAKAQVQPTGKGIGVTTTKGSRTSQRVEYHGGPVLSVTPGVSLIFYGGWSGSPGVPILIDLVTGLGNSGYFGINTLYPDANGDAPSGDLYLRGWIIDSYSHGAVLTEADAASIVSDRIAAGDVSFGTDVIYVLLLAADVDIPPGYGTSYCGYHGRTSANGVMVPYIVVGYAGRVPTKCGVQAVSPNGFPAADAMASVLANELSNTVTDPAFTAWYDRFGLEQADKCAWSYGTTYTTTNGARANVRLSNRDYLLQQLWIPGQRGRCALGTPAQ